MTFVSRLTSGGLAKGTLALLLSLLPSLVLAQQPLSLEQAIGFALQNDLWFDGSKLQQQASLHQSVAATSLPDPKLSIAVANLPTDSWRFDQEAMSQFTVGLAQQFPRGDSRAIKARQLKIEASQYPLLRAERKAKLIAKVSQLWLDAYLAQQKISLLIASQALFEQMIDVAEARYATAIGKTRQQEVIGAQLEVIQLQDRLAQQQQVLATALARLGEWLPGYQPNKQGQAFTIGGQAEGFSVASSLPEIPLVRPEITETASFSYQTLARLVSIHPAVLAVEVKRKSAQQGIDLAKQQYKPQWGVKASYGYRDDMPSGQHRADLFSVGVTLDLPLFTGQRQDRQVAASVAKTEAITTEKLLLIKQMASALAAELGQLNRLTERNKLYQAQLVNKAHQHAEAALTAYTNDDGSFAEVVSAKITALNSQISALQLKVAALQAVARINYFFASASDEQVAAKPKSNVGLAVGDK